MGVCTTPPYHSEATLKGFTQNQTTRMLATIAVFDMPWLTKNRLSTRPPEWNMALMMPPPTPIPTPAGRLMGGGFIPPRASRQKSTTAKRTQVKPMPFLSQKSGRVTSQ